MFEQIKKFLTAPIFENDEEKNRIAGILYRILISIWILLPLALIAMAINPQLDKIYIPLSIMVVVAATGLMFLTRLGYVRAASISLVSTLLVLSAITDAASGGQTRPLTLLSATVVIAAGLLLGTRGVIATAIIYSIKHGIILLLVEQKLIQTANPYPGSLADFIITSIGYLLLGITFNYASSGISQSLRRAHNSERKLANSNQELQEMARTLETRVNERTKELNIAVQNNSRRAAQFEALTQVTQAINSLRKMDELLPRITSVISEQFGYYHAGIFLNDENNLFTYLTASNSEGGKRMLERGHNLKIGEQGIVGHVAGTGTQRVARNVGEDVVYFNNPDLPETKSEMGLPLRSGNKVVGVLDVQSTKEDAFSQEDIRVLGILADQVSLAIDNTRLYETTRRSLEEAEALYRQYLRQAWSRLPREQQLAGYRYSQRGTMPLEVPVIFDTEEKKGEKKDVEEGARLNVPIKLRGETIGNLIVHVAQNRNWNQDQIDLVEAVAERVALSAENARLFDETSRRAERERMVTEITSKIRSTNDPEAMIQTALDELRNALGASQVQLIPQAISASQQNQSEIISSTPQDSAQKAQRGNGARK